MDESSNAKKMVEICQRLHAKNMLAAADGNVSVRISNEEILITPSQRHKGFLQASDLATITLEDRVVSGTPSSERAMHLAVYRKVPHAKCIVHAHPPVAIAWSVARPELEELPSDALSEVILAAGRIPIIPYARPGTKQMGAALESFLPQCRIFILARHGALTWGESLEEAYWGMERLEHSATILKAAVELGGVHKLPPEEVQHLRKLRHELGEKIL